MTTPQFLGMLIGEDDEERRTNEVRMTHFDCGIGVAWPRRVLKSTEMKWTLFAVL